MACHVCTSGILECHPTNTTKSLVHKYILSNACGYYNLRPSNNADFILGHESAILGQAVGSPDYS